MYPKLLVICANILKDINRLAVSLLEILNRIERWPVTYEIQKINRAASLHDAFALASLIPRDAIIDNSGPCRKNINNNLKTIIKTLTFCLCQKNNSKHLSQCDTSYNTYVQLYSPEVFALFFQYPRDYLKRYFLLHSLHSVHFFTCSSSLTCSTTGCLTSSC